MMQSVGHPPHFASHSSAPPPPTSPLDAYAVQADALAVLSEDASAQGGISGGRFVAYASLTLIVLPVATLIGLMFVTDWSNALIGGACALPVGLALLVLLIKVTQKPAAPGASTGPSIRTNHALGTLGWEAQLSLPPLQARLSEKLDALGPSPSPTALAEVAFYTHQARQIRAVLAHPASLPGRGYVGFDTYGTPQSSWDRGLV